MPVIPSPLFLISSAASLRADRYRAIVGPISAACERFEALPGWVSIVIVGIVFGVAIIARAIARRRSS